MKAYLFCFGLFPLMAVALALAAAHLVRAVQVRLSVQPLRVAAPLRPQPGYVPTGWSFTHDYIAARGPRLHGWRLVRQQPAGAPAPPVVLYFHGNFGHVRFFEGEIHRWTEVSSAVLAFDYRGFGASDGTARADTILQDAERCFQRARELAGELTGDTAHVVVVGFSLGTAAAIHVAGRFDGRLRAVVLEAPFQTLKTATLHTFPVLGAVAPLLAPVLDNSVGARAIHRTPLAVVHGEYDPICPIRDGRALLRAAPTPHKRFFVSKVLGHVGLHADGAVLAWVVAQATRPSRRGRPPKLGRELVAKRVGQA